MVYLQFIFIELPATFHTASPALSPHLVLDAHQFLFVITVYIISLAPSFHAYCTHVNVNRTNINTFAKIHS